MSVLYLHAWIMPLMKTIERKMKYFVSLLLTDVLIFSVCEELGEVEL